MKKNLILPLSAIAILYFSCSKSNNKENSPTTTTPVKIEVVSGSGQSDTIGKPLPNPVVVKVTQNGTPLSGYKVEYIGSGCNSDNTITVATQADGTTSANWWLAGDVGRQTMEVYAVNSQNQKVDSVSATATGIATGPGWHYSACAVPFGYTAASIIKLSSGRLFTCTNGDRTYIRFSDDNGASWNAVKSLGNSHAIFLLLASSTDEIYAFASGESIYYSNDGGQTWTAEVFLPFNTVSSAICTGSGKLIVTEQASVNISVDKGKNWIIVPRSAFSPPNSSGGGDTNFNSPAEDQQGNLYVAGQESETIYKSTDAGITWTPIPRPNILDFALYIDHNNWFYLSRSEPGTGGIYISKDAGITYNKIVSYGNVFIDNMSVQSDGNFYYQYLGVGLYQATGINSPVKRIFDYSLNFAEDAPYVVAKNNNIITADVGQNFIRYYTK